MKSSLLTLAIIIIILVGGGIYLSCTSDSNINEKKRLLLVFADLTGSMDQQGVNHVADKAKKIFSSLPEGAKMHVKLIDSNNSRHAVFEGEIPELTGNSIALKSAHKTSISQQADSLEELLLQTYTSSPPMKSCIFNSFESVFTFFRSQDSLTYDYELIFLSDMIEECSSSFTHLKTNMNMRSDSGSAPELEELIAKVDSNYSPDFNLKELIKPENLYCIVTPSDHYKNQKGCMQTRDSRKLWQHIFTKLGYSESETNSLFIETSLPFQFQNSVYQ